MPSWSVMASAARPRRAASATSSAGAEAPSRKLYDEWQCSSAQPGRARRRALAGRAGAAGGGQAGHRARPWLRRPFRVRGPAGGGPPGQAALEFPPRHGRVVPAHDLLLPSHGAGRRQSYLASISQLPSCTATSQAAPSSVTSWNLARLRAAPRMPPPLGNRPRPGPGGDRQPRRAIGRHPGGRRGDQAPPADGHRGAGAVGDPGGQRGRVDRGRRRRGDPPRPGPARPARAVRPARLTCPARPARRQHPVAAAAVRHQRHLLVRAAAARRHRARHRVMPEHGLHADGGPGHPVGDHRIAPQAELPALVADQLIGGQPQQRDPARVTIGGSFCRPQGAGI